VVFTLYFLAALGRVVSGAAVAYAGKNHSKLSPALCFRLDFLLYEKFSTKTKL
jgi:hypothetical protein